MESVLGRYRNLIILVGVLFLQVLGLAVQVKRSSSDAENTRLIRIWAVGAITPFERGLVWVRNGTSDLWHNYFYLRGVRAENRQLKEQIEQMRLEQMRLREDAAQAHRLQALLAFKEQFISKTVAAQVIGTSGMDSSRVVYLDKGGNDGLRRDMAVITADGVVGKVWEVYPSVSKVLLINDQSSGVGVIVGDGRLQGWLGGATNGEAVLNNLMSDEQVPVGEKVLTSGGDLIFPKGLPVGTVTKVGKGKEGFLSIRVRPAANLSKLEEVLVVVEKQERPAAEENVRLRAADVLAQRLPSVPDKPVTDSGAAATAGVAGTSPAVGTAATPQTQTQNKQQSGAPTKTPAQGALVKPGTAGNPSIAVGATPGPKPAPPQSKATSPAASKSTQTPANPPEPANEDSPH